MRLCAAPRGEGSQGAEVADEITFQNDPVDPSDEFRKQHNHFFVHDRDGAREWRPPA
jgi:hypothetical protein